MTLLERLEKRASVSSMLGFASGKVIKGAKKLVRASEKAGKGVEDLKRFAKEVVAKRKANFRRGQEAALGTTGKARRAENLAVLRDISDKGNALRAQKAKKTENWKRLGIGTAAAAGGLGLGALLLRKKKSEDQEAYPGVGY